MDGFLLDTLGVYGNQQLFSIACRNKVTHLTDVTIIC
jgi:hypothetical protein